MNAPSCARNWRRREGEMKVWLIRMAIAGVLALVFLAYLRPAFMLDLANRFYMCW